MSEKLPFSFADYLTKHAVINISGGIGAHSVEISKKKVHMFSSWKASQYQK